MQQDHGRTYTSPVRAEELARDAYPLNIGERNVFRNERQRCWCLRCDDDN